MGAVDDLFGRFPMAERAYGRTRTTAGVGGRMMRQESFGVGITRPMVMTAG